MEANQKSFLLRSTAALTTVLIALAVRSLLTPLVGEELPFTTIFPAVAISALIGGLGAGLAATLIGALAVNFFFMSPSYDLTLSDPHHLTQLIVVLSTGSFISWIVAERGRIQLRLAQVETDFARRSRESEKALRESEERSRLAQKSTGVGIWEWDLQTDAVEWSEGVYELLGLDVEETETYFKDWFKFIVPEDRERTLAHIQNLIDDGYSEFYDEFRIRRQRDGVVRWVVTQGQIIRDENNRAVRVRGVNYDITPRKEAEFKIRKLNQELDRRLKELETILDIAPVGIAVAHDPDCRIITANPALARMVGVAPGDNVSLNEPNNKLPFKHLRNGRELTADELPMQRAVAEKRTIFNEEIDILRADGSLITIYGYAAPVFDENGNVISCVAAQIDITERKQIERERERKLNLEQDLRRQAEESSRLKDEFLATISHELRTPLNSILGWVTMLRQNLLPGTVKSQALEAIERGAKSQSQLIEDLLDVSRIISGKLQLNIQPVEINSIINAAIETLRPAAEAKGIELKTHLNSQTGVITGDFDRLQQVVWNLLSNAIKFTPKGGRVAVVFHESSGHAEIIVSDTGRGISEEFLPFVFDRFRQADGSITRSFTGLGLGLSIVRHLVELHGGLVRVESEGEGKGATFTVELPLLALPVRAEAEAVTPAGTSESEAKKDFPVLKGFRVLLVDDEENTRKILQLAFERCQASVEAADSAESAFAKVKKAPPHLIVSDIGMPEEDGYSFIQKVRNWERAAHRRPIPAIALTAYARAEDRAQALEAGFHAHVTKPIEPVNLADLAASLLTESKTADKTAERKQQPT